MSAPKFTPGECGICGGPNEADGERETVCIECGYRVEHPVFDAAPELYAACQAAEAFVVSVNRAFYVTGTRKAMMEAMGGQREILAAARAALRKAEGGDA